MICGFYCEPCPILLMIVICNHLLIEIVSINRNAAYSQLLSKRTPSGLSFGVRNSQSSQQRGVMKMTQCLVCEMSHITYAARIFKGFQLLFFFNLWYTFTVIHKLVPFQV